VTDQSDNLIRDPAETPPPGGAAPEEEDGLSLPEEDGLSLASSPSEAPCPQPAEPPAVERPVAEEPPVEAPKAAEPPAEQPPAEKAEPGPSEAGPSEAGPSEAKEPGVEPPVVSEAAEERPVAEKPPSEEAAGPGPSPAEPAAGPSPGEPAAAPPPAEPPAEPEPAVAEAAAEPAPAAPEPKSDKMDWYILKVQSNREESIREGLRRRVAIAGLGYHFGDIIIPTEKVTEFKAGKRKVFKRKLYPGYLVVQMEINEETWFLVRETPGIGDFTGAAGHPTPMHAREVASILAKQEEKADEAPKLKIAFRAGDRVKIKEGTFENFEGEVATIDETNGRVTVLINIFGRSTPVDIEYWQIEAV
jgi:transcriptional antiterminator NusG